MVLRRALVFAGITVAATAAVALYAVQPVEVQARRVFENGVCATETPSADEVTQIESMSRPPEGNLDNPITIQVMYHVINKGAGIENGDVPETMLQAQVDALNNAFSGGAGGANTNFRFALMGITRTTNAAWYTAAYHSAEEYAMKEALRVGGVQTLNIYSTDSPWNWAAFPWVYASAPLHDGVVLRHQTLPGSGNQYFGTGDIGVHEVGHWLGLYHTYQGECTTTNDHVADTPAMKAGGAQSCPSPRDTCKGKNYPGTDPLNNYMTGMIDSCANQFTAGQSTRMSTMWATWRQ